MAKQKQANIEGFWDAWDGDTCKAAFFLTEAEARSWIARRFLDRLSDKAGVPFEYDIKFRRFGELADE